MEIVNPGLSGDYHMHSLQYSDGLPTIDEIVQYAGRLGLEEIAITDHSQAALDRSGLTKKAHRSIVQRWENVHNDVKVIFGVEGDLLDEEGNICEDIAGHTSDFLILSLHHQVYQGNFSKVTEAYLKAMEKYGQKIRFLGHPHIQKGTEHLDMAALVEAANHHDIPLEFNGRYFRQGGNADNLQIMLQKADRIYVNSDAHTLSELRDHRRACFNFLKQESYLS
ncbi:hypothetical protein COV20_04730 [Candidatus Woesearchaeota archaeon CG10_big_fil_rev_8_21_14_0_10_45_16]|nr:MAG: hypothetical protein COV20_04730 [Candidatus Woesearchaeota archaeon CG10_big_fil_rev_8_21_14_0_10_45_16]